MASDTIKAVLNWQSADFWEAVAKFDTYNIEFVVQKMPGTKRHWSGPPSSGCTSFLAQQHWEEHFLR